MHLNDPEIRELLYPMLQGDVLDELTIGIETGRCTRADVVHFTNGQMHGYEIKGDGDTLKRLPLQLMCYGWVFDRITFVVTNKHALQVIDLLPQWAGIYIAYPDFIFRLREPSAHDNLNRQMLAALLWGKECLVFLKRYGIKALTKYRCFEMWDLIDQSPLISTADLSAFVSACIVARLAQKAKRKAKNRIIREYSK